MAEATALREVITTSDFEQHNATEQKGAELAVSVDTSEMVQYMVEKGLKEVPPEYVLPHKHRPSATKTKNLPGNLRIPVIDMGDFHHKDGAERVIGEIGRACEEWGFFQVPEFDKLNPQPFSSLDSVSFVMSCALFQFCVVKCSCWSFTWRMIAECAGD